MGIGAAIAASAALSATAAVGGSVISSQASKSAASQQANAATNAQNASLGEAATTRADLSPYRDIGLFGKDELLGSLGIGDPSRNVLAANGVNGLTYQTPDYYNSVLSNPQYQIPGQFSSILNNPQYQTPGQFSSVLNNPQFNPTQAQLEATPGYQFTLNQGLQSTQNANAAKGLGVSGAALKGAAQYATGLANNTLQTQANIFNQNYQNALSGNTQGGQIFQNTYNNALTGNTQNQNIFNQNYSNALTGNQQGQGIFQSNYANVINPLQNLVTIGQNAATQTGTQGLQAVQSANQYGVGAGNAAASGIVGSANALSGGLQAGANAPLNTMLYQQLLNNTNNTPYQPSSAYQNEALPYLAAGNPSGASPTSLGGYY